MEAAGVRPSRDFVKPSWDLIRGDKLEELRDLRDVEEERDRPTFSIIRFATNNCRSITRPSFLARLRQFWNWTTLSLHAEWCQNLAYPNLDLTRSHRSLPCQAEAIRWRGEGIIIKILFEYRFELLNWTWEEKRMRQANTYVENCPFSDRTTR